MGDVIEFPRPNKVILSQRVSSQWLQALQDTCDQKFDPWADPLLPGAQLAKALTLAELEAAYCKTLECWLLDLTDENHESYRQAHYAWLVALGRVHVADIEEGR